MAVKARATVTLASIKDVASTTRYYLLQSSTAAKPTKPTTNPPGGSWVKTEPSYTSGSTNSLYITDLTVFSDETFVYSDVSLSSSFEAAKTAYNKAASAEDRLNALIASSEIVVGTQTKATGSWTGVAGFSSLEDGQQIAYWLPYAGSGSATLNLTLSGGGTTGAIPVYYRGSSRATTHFAAGTVIHLTYRVDANVNGTEYTGWWADASYDSGNTYNRIKFENAVHAKTSFAASRFIVSDEDGYFPISGGISFDITKPILWAASSITGGATGTNNYLAMNSLTLRNNLAGVTLTQYETCYLVGTLSGKTFTVKVFDYLTSTVPTSDDGLYYIALGYLYSTYQIYLYPEHPVYKFVNGTFMSLQQVAYEASVTAQDAKESIDTLEIGARNLLLNSEEARVTPASASNSAYTEYYYPSEYGESFLSDMDQFFTVSAVYEMTGNESDGGYLYAQVNGTAIANCTGYAASCNQYVLEEPSGTYKRTFRLTSSQAGATSKYLRFRLKNATDGAVLTISKVKLELGNRATDWSPAPEDVDGAIQESADEVRTYAESCISQKSDEIEMSISEVTGVLTTDIQDCRDLVSETEDALNGSMNDLTSRVSSQEDDLLAYKHETSMYFRFNTDGLNIGKQTDGAVSPFAINIDNEKMAFLQNGSEVAYVKYNRLHINAVEAVDRLSVGARAHGGYFDFISTPQGMGVKWRAVQQADEEEDLVGSSDGEDVVGASYTPITDDEDVFSVDFGGGT